LAKQPKQPTKPKYRQQVTALISQRDQLIDEILMRSRVQGSSPFIRKAGALLTRFWARADWQGREALLRTAHWLVTLGAYHEPTATKRPRMRKMHRRAPATRVGRPHRGKPVTPARWEVEADAG
jgi:hypothetical protein